MKLTEFLVLAQARFDGQSEYVAAYALTGVVVFLGLVALCIPRPRAKHFIEPEEDEDPKKKKK